MDFSLALLWLICFAFKVLQILKEVFGQSLIKKVLKFEGRRGFKMKDGKVKGHVSGQTFLKDGSFRKVFWKILVGYRSKYAR